MVIKKLSLFGVVLQFCLSPILAMASPADESGDKRKNLTGIECYEHSQSEVKTKGNFRMSLRDMMMVSECGKDLTDGFGKPISSAEKKDLLKECREELTEQYTEQFDESKEELKSAIAELNKKLGTKIKFDERGKQQLVKAIVNALLSTKQTDVNYTENSSLGKGAVGEYRPASTLAELYMMRELSEEKVAEYAKILRPATVDLNIVRLTDRAGNKWIFDGNFWGDKSRRARLDRDLERYNTMVSDLNNLAFSPYNFSSRHYLGSLPDVISEIVEPKLDLPKVQMIVNKELPGTQILVTVFEKNESGEEVITAQNSYPLGEHVLKLPVKSYLGGRVIFEATYSFGCKAAPQK